MRSALPALFLTALTGATMATACGPRGNVDRAEDVTPTPGAQAPATPSPDAGPAPSANPNLPDAGVAGPASDAGLAVDGGAGASAPQSPTVAPDAAADITIGTTPISPPSPPSPASSLDAAVADASNVGVATIDSQPAPPQPAIDVAPPLRPTVAFMVAAPGAPTPVETQMRLRLEARGFAVRFIADNAPAAEASDAGLLLISATVHSPSLTIGFHTLAKPIIAMKASLFDELGMTGAVRGADSGEDTGAEVRITDAAHPLAAGLSGLVRIVPAPAAVTWGRPPPGAAKIAVMGLEPTKVALFAFERGTMMLDRVAPARRVGFFATDRSGVSGTNEAMRLFDAAVDWSLR